MQWLVNPVATPSNGSWHRSPKTLSLYVLCLHSADYNRMSMLGLGPLSPFLGRSTGKQIEFGAVYCLKAKLCHCQDGREYCREWMSECASESVWVWAGVGRVSNFLFFVLSSRATLALEVNFVRLLQLENTWLVGSPGGYPLPILCNTNPPFSIWLPL